MKLRALNLSPNESYAWPTLSDSFVSPKVQVHPPTPRHAARDLMEQVQQVIPGDAFQPPRA